MTLHDALQRRYGLIPTDPPYPVEVRGASRLHLPEVFADMGFTRGAEIGTWKGEYAEALCRIPGLHLTCVDPWVPYEDYADHRTRQSIDDAYAEAMARLDGFDVRVVRAFSPGAAAEVEDGSLDFIYIDGNHRYEYVVADLAAWIPKVRRGGVIAGHDYKQIPTRPSLQVVEAVNGWTRAYRIAPWFVLGRSRTRQGEVRDKHRSWLWEQV